VVANEGSVAALAVSARGNPRPMVYWRKGRMNVDTRTSPRFLLEDDGTLKVWTMSSQHSGDANAH